MKKSVHFKGCILLWYVNYISVFRKNGKKEYSVNNFMLINVKALAS